MSRGGARPGAGRPRKKRLSQIVELAEETGGKTETGSTDLEAGEFLRQVWNDPRVEISLRIRAAEIVFRGAGKQGKKDEKQDRAAMVAAGKFAPSRPPSLKVVKFEE